MSLSGAVIDKYSRDALIAIAAEEGLLVSNTRTDGVFEKICRTPVDHRVREQILEQLVLTPTLVTGWCEGFLWDALGGRLKEEGHLLNVHDSIEVPDQVETISLDVLAGLVQASGHNIPVTEFGPRADAAMASVQEQEDYVQKTGKEAPSGIRRMIQTALRHGTDIPDLHSEEEYAAQRRRENTYSAFAPIAEAVVEYSAVAQLASKHDLLLKTPVFSDFGQTQVANPRYLRRINSDALILLRIVASELGRTTLRGTLSECLNLATDPATVALREQISMWQYNLAVGDEAALRSIRKEIRQATTALARLSGVRTVGNITTWLSVPIAVAELVLALPPVLGISIGIVGKLASAKEMAVNRKYKWASYGGS
jgi:hypothetical protein